MSALRNEVIDYDYREKPLVKDLNPQKKNRKIRNKRNSKKQKQLIMKAVERMSMVVTIFILGIVIIYNYAIIIDKKVKLNTISEEVVNLNNDIDTYNIALETLNNTGTIEEMAKSYLGMNYPNRKQTQFIDIGYNNIEDTNNQNFFYSLIKKAKSFVSKIQI